MGKIRDLEIRYDRPSVFAGNLLTGSLCFHLKETCKFKDLSIWVEGQTKVTLPGDSSSERWLLRSEINLSTYLLQYEYRLPRGVHQVPFGFPLPPFLPSSFGDKHGYIYYCCRAVLANGTHRVRKPFALIGVEDLNWHPYATMPVTVRDYGCKSFWAFGRQQGSVQVLLSLERTGYVPGDLVEITAEIVNNSKKKLKSSMIQLRQGVLYKTAGGRTKEVFQIVADLQHGPIQPSAIDQWEKEQLLIPPVPPSFLRGSDNISLKYELLFTVPDANVNLILPLIIGTVPYRADAARRVVKALPWHTRAEEGIYGTRGPSGPPPPVPQDMQIHQAYYGAHGRDENGGPIAESVTECSDEVDDQNNNNYRGGTKYAIYGKAQEKKPYQGKLRTQNQEQVYGTGKNGCYYYNEQPRFLRIEEID